MFHQEDESCQVGDPLCEIIIDDESDTSKEKSVYQDDKCDHEDVPLKEEFKIPEKEEECGHETYVQNENITVPEHAEIAYSKCNH